MKRKKMLLVGLVAAALIMVAGISVSTAYAAPISGAAAVGQNYEANKKFEEQKNVGQIAFYICGGIFVCGVLFKVGAIITGVISGKRLGRARKKFKEAQKNRPSTESPLEEETKRYLDYMESRRDKPK